MLLFVIHFFVLLATSSSTPSPTLLLLQPTHFNASESTSTSLCPTPLLPCASLPCYNPSMHKCCPGSHNLCLADQVCGQAEASNGTLAFGCCPNGSSVCGDRCFDTNLHKCCVGRGAKYGLCPRGADCCENMCCGAGEVCVAGTGGMMCWPKGRGSGSIGDEPSGTGIGAGASETKSSGGGKLVPSKLFLILLLLLPFAASSFTFNTVAVDQFPCSTTPNIPQTIPSRVPLSRRWSCRSPKETCGEGCFVLTDSKCCGAGLCSVAFVCCRQYCCPEGTVYKQELALNWCVSQSKIRSAPGMNNESRNEKDIKIIRVFDGAAIPSGIELLARENENKEGDALDAVGAEKKSGGRGGGGRGGGRGGGGVGSGGSNSGTSTVAMGYFKSTLCVASLTVVYSFLSLV